MEIVINNEKVSVIEATVTFTAEEWKAAQDKSAEKLAANVQLPGFRKGKAPVEMVKKVLDAQKVMNGALDVIIPTGYEKVIAENNYDVLIQPSVRIDELSDAKVVITYIITVRPEVKLGQYKGLSVAKNVAEATDEELNIELINLQNRCAELKVKEEGVVEKGNIVNFDFTGYVDGEAFEGGSAEKFDLEIGSNQFIPGFEDQMVGLKAGVESSIDVTFPENYVKELAGKAATFKILIHEIKEKVLPAINDDLALDANIEGVSNLEELKVYFKNALAKNKEAQATKAAFDELVKTIMDGAEVVVPQTIIDMELERSLAAFKQNVEDKGLTFEQYCDITATDVEKVKADILKDIVPGMKTMFVLSQIAKENDIKITPEDIEAEYAKIASMYNMEVDQVKAALKNRHQEIVDQLFSARVSEFILSVNEIQ